MVADYIITIVFFLQGTKLITNMQLVLPRRTLPFVSQNYIEVSERWWWMEGQIL